ncbi:transmembrane protein [Polymorphum gilvum]|uniref:Putative transmembrane protein n=1 Tax=Polymorphum gilvum (strain LMG 25793 / CGMCC 1.9160 / SL003B-26A1) TaxID=991905 RepID=F2J5L7_POLGS|nr:transmembrane protein [Polymorphum gilvum]ADZ70101.1 putative transmembrane protein [Polymorphum gilvum SL003B-26A1]
MTDPFYIYRPLLDLIGRSEGTDRGRGYNETLGYGAFSGGDHDLVAMTLDQIDELQTAMLAHPKNSLNSSALGRYQIVRTTLRKIRKQLKLSGLELYSAEMQDRLGCYLLGVRGIDRWLGGVISRDALMDALAKEWASLPTSKGVGHYSGQRASVSTAAVFLALEEVQRRRGLHTGAPVTAKPPQSASGKDAAAAGAAAAAGTCAAAVTETDNTLVLLLAGTLAMAGVLAVYLAWRHRTVIRAFLKSMGDKL